MFRLSCENWLGISQENLSKKFVLAKKSKFALNYTCCKEFHANFHVEVKENLDFVVIIAFVEHIIGRSLAESKIEPVHVPLPFAKAKVEFAGKAFA